MAGKQAKVLSDREVALGLKYLRQRRYADRDRVIFLLSIKAGLRAGEIANLTWPMVLDATGNVADMIELHDAAAKMLGGGAVPLNPDLKKALITLYKKSAKTGAIICSERGNAMRASSIVNWFATLYQQLGLQGCSSHSGRRTFITKGARMVFKVGGSLRDVQQLAGHSSIEMTQRYIEGDTKAKRQLVAML